MRRQMRSRWRSSLTSPATALCGSMRTVAPFSETQGELTISGFEYDEYYLELPFYDGIYDDILGSFDGYFAQAKLAEAEKGDHSEAETAGKRPAKRQ